MTDSTAAPAAREAWGDAWTETEEPVPDKPHVPPDHWIRTR